MKRLVACALVLAIGLALCGDLLARAGGGHSYSGGGRSYSSGHSYSGGGGYHSYGGGGGGGGGDGGDFLFFIIRCILELCLDYPPIGIPLVLFVIFMVIRYWNDPPGPMYQTNYDLGRRPMPDQRKTNAPEQQLERLKHYDPNFSRPLFLDFLGVLYTRAVPARATGKVEPIEPYLAPELAMSWRSHEGGGGRVASVDEVVVGAARVVSVRGIGTPRVALQVELEACFREHRQAGDPGHSFWVREQWVLERAGGVLSKTPEQIAKLGCPSCGAPCELKPDGTCTYCDKVVNRGNFDWQVTGARVFDRVDRAPENMLVSGGGEEVGTDLPTRFQDNIEAARRAFLGRHPDFDRAGFELHVRETFMEIQRAWTAMDWDRARRWETDNLFATHRYWQEMYKAAGLRNVLEKINVERIVFVRFELDAFYESITVRVWASMVDYTVDRNGSTICGDRNIARKFTEYWTFIAAVGAPVKAGPLDAHCPQCGAPMQLTQSGHCTHCDAVVTSGRFGWVLSRIDQDESYAG